ncbi:hypothetical protein GE061_003170 [Apolygus lucorum]|uniref:Glucose-methanol-choline oxidoreductase N-terminal domain-containing protein n=1 Tax=Apolygus lucorum TaxID=248454 RepID=A0A8S9X324_APOLU|nr:hypothetical protein GE061_003170 [Apolygus lucorum]
MPIKYIGRTTDFSGKTLWEILGNLKNFGVGRLVMRNMHKRYEEPSFYRILKVETLPQKEGVDRKVRAIVEKVFRGQRYPNAIEMESQSYKSDFRLVPKHEEPNLWKAVEGVKVEEKILPAAVELPPLLKHLLQEEAKSSGTPTKEQKLKLVINRSGMKHYRVAAEGETPNVEIGKTHRDALSEIRLPHHPDESQRCITLNSGGRAFGVSHLNRRAQLESERPDLSEGLFFGPVPIKGYSGLSPTSFKPTSYFFSNIRVSPYLGGYDHKINVVDCSNRGESWTDACSLRDSYDFIIIGGGTAGSILAHRLSEVPQWSVLLLEAGQDETFESKVPFFPKLLENTPMDWNYTTTRQKNCGSVGGYCEYPRGRALGGSSSTNYMLYMRGLQADFDKWENEGNPGWSYNDVLSYFDKSVNFVSPKLASSGSGGPLPVSESEPIWLTAYLTKALQELGLQERNLNDGTGGGFMPIQVNVLNGERVSANSAFLKPVLNRENLDVLTSSFVKRIVFEDKTAVGVEFDVAGSPGSHFVSARKEVILSAGSINSPQILMLSGVGPSQHLQELRIPVVQDSPVGMQLQDHVGIFAYFQMKNVAKSTAEEVMTNLKQYLKNKSGTLSIPLGGLVVVMRNSSLSTMDNPDMQLHLGIGENQNVCYMNGFVSRPESRGRLSLRSNSPWDPPLIDPNYLNSPKDITILRELVEFIFQLALSTSFRDLGTAYMSLLQPGCEQEFTDCFIRRFSHTFYHPVATCKMAPQTDPYAVVDSNLKVYGVDKLRVVDASVMPNVPSSNINAPVMMVAEKAADMIKQYHFSTDNCCSDNPIPTKNLFWSLKFVVRLGSNMSLLSSVIMVIFGLIRASNSEDSSAREKRYHGGKCLYDFIIIGGGSAGCLLANRLSKVGLWNILLLEAGEEETFTSKVPFFPEVSQKTSVDWNFTTTKQTKSCLSLDGYCEIPRGRVLGGSSSINYLIHMRGQPQDFDNWAAAGNLGWSYEEIVPFFESVENHYDESLNPGNEDSLPVKEVPADWWSDTFRTALSEFGLSQKDFNKGDRGGGFMLIQATVRDGKRVSANTAFLKPSMDRPNLDVMTSSFVRRILIENQTAVGVEFERKNQIYTVFASREIILSTGAINSPKILMLSGVGPAEALKHFGIPVVQDLPVGSVLQDHIGISLNFLINDTRRPFKDAVQLIQQYLHDQSGLFGMVNGRIVALMNSSLATMDYPDMEIILGRQGEETEFYISGFVSRPESRGKLTLRSHSPYDDPLINSNFLSTKKDNQIAREMVEMIFRLVFSSSLKDLSPEYIAPSPWLCEGQADLIGCTIQQYSQSYYHPVSTCRMGPTTDSNAVVDPELKVHGVRRLRVVDASVMPSLPSTNINSATLMVAEKASYMIKRDHECGKR